MLLGRGDGTFLTSSGYGTGGYRSHSVAVGDVNGDGKIDLLVANDCINLTDCNNGAVGVLLGQGDGTFTTLRSLPSRTSTAMASWMLHAACERRFDAQCERESRGAVDLGAAATCAKFGKHSVPLPTLS